MLNIKMEMQSVKTAEIYIKAKGLFFSWWKADDSFITYGNDWKGTSVVSDDLKIPHP